MATRRDASANLVRIILAAPMKSASTYAGNVLGQYFQILEPPELTHVDFMVEHNITPWLIHDVRDKSFCFNFHMMPHASNLIVARAEQIAVVVLWRNIGDMIVSYDDHQFGPEAGNSPHFFLLNHERYRSSEPAERYAYLIETLAPWYLSFYARWRSCDVVMHPYEQLVADRRAYFYEILEGLLGAPPIGELLDMTLETKPGTVSRYNVGRIGRSAEKFSDATKRRLEEKILSHPDREQLEILLWELPWDVPALRSDLPLDGCVVRCADDEMAYFVSGGRAHAIERRSWLASRVGERRTPRLVERAELAAYPLGEPLI